jgi:hypothetical protein
MEDDDGDGDDDDIDEDADFPHPPPPGMSALTSVTDEDVDQVLVRIGGLRPAVTLFEVSPKGLWQASSVKRCLIRTVVTLSFARYAGNPSTR